mgnify:CR=1 FL=1
MCQKCGCNTCETIRGPLLTEGRVKKLVSENLQYHIDKNIPLMENVFRIGSDAHLSMIKEARKLYSRGVLDLCEEDEGLMETHIGEFDLYENEIVPLDLPMLEENYSPEFKIGDFVQPIEGATSYLFSYNDNDINNKRILSKYVGQIEDVYINKPENLEMKDGEYLYSVANLNNSEIHSAFGFKESALELISDPTDYIKSLTSLDEAKKKKKKEKKDPPIGKPKRGGSKAYYVYVRSPKTKKVKKVSFGSGGLRAKIRNPKARKAFAARHNCKNKKDRTTAGYWSCNLPRYASQLGLGANMNTFW